MNSTSNHLNNKSSPSSNPNHQYEYMRFVNLLPTKNSNIANSRPLREPTYVSINGTSNNAAGNNAVGYANSSRPLREPTYVSLNGTGNNAAGYDNNTEFSNSDNDNDCNSCYYNTNINNLIT